MRKKIVHTILFLFTALCIVGWESCYYDVEEELYPITNCDTASVSYSQDILPILTSRCFECHGNGHIEGGVSLDPYDNLKIWVNAGRVVGAINHEAGFFPMPKDNPMLPDCDIMLIESWVNEGAPNN